MRLRLRTRCPLWFKQCLIKSVAYADLTATLCHRYLYAIVCLLVIFLFVWWSGGEHESCDGRQIVHSVCHQFQEREVTGDLCKALCVTGNLDVGICIKSKNHIKTFHDGSLVSRVAQWPVGSVGQELVEGVEFEQFIINVEKLLHAEFGRFDTSPLMNRLIQDFDVNNDDRINFGEAQNMWQMLRQPYFLQFYIFQDNTAVPHLNGSCGGISMWHYPHLTKGATLYRKDSPATLFSRLAYRWTLPSWLRRAKVTLSLLELVEELYEKDGIRFHLCNLNGMTLHHLYSYEVMVTEETMLLSSQQIQNRLSNISCHHPHDCVLTPQCETTCDITSKRCTGTLMRPTLAFACDIVEEYLLFDTPRHFKPWLTRLVHRCQGLSPFSLKADLTHSVLIADIKSILWKLIQYSLK